MNELADVNDRVLDLQEKLVAPCVSSPDARFPVSAHYACPVPCTSPSTTSPATNCSSCWTKRCVRLGGRELLERRRESPVTVLAAMGVSHERARGSLRLSMGPRRPRERSTPSSRFFRASSTGCRAEA